MVTRKDAIRAKRSSGSSRNRAQIGLPARRYALRLVTQVLDKSEPLSEPSETVENANSELGLTTRDMALARNIALTTLRRLGEVNAVLSRVYERGLPSRAGNLKAILQTAVCQILFLDISDHAAVDLAVRLAKYDRRARHHAGLVNGGLRRVSREGAALLEGLDAPRLNTPDWLWQSWVAQWGEAAARAVAAAQMTEPPLDITAAKGAEHWARQLDGTLLDSGSIRLEKSGPVERLPGYDTGAWWVQDAAAALPVGLLGDIRGKRVVDLCAAPGGKTLQLAAAGADVVALDRSAHRMRRVRENLSRAGLAAEIVVSDALEWDPGEQFDAILLDAPCTATGTIRRHPDVARIKSPSDREGLVLLQSELLDLAVSLVKPGGVVVYCTCSLDPEECENRIKAFLQRKSRVRRIPVSGEEIGGLAEAITPVGDMRTLPSMTPKGDARGGGMDGFYASRLEVVSS